MRNKDCWFGKGGVNQSTLLLARTCSRGLLNTVSFAKNSMLSLILICTFWNHPTFYSAICHFGGQEHCVTLHGYVPGLHFFLTVKWEVNNQIFIDVKWASMCRALVQYSGGKVLSQCDNYCLSTLDLCIKINFHLTESRIWSAWWP